MKKLNYIFLLLLVISLMISCSKNDDSNTENRFNDEVITILNNEKAIGYFPNTKTPYTFFDENLYTIMLYDKNINSIIDGVYLKNDISEALMYFDTESFLPTSLTSTDGDIILFFYNNDLTEVTMEFQYENQNNETITFETNPEDLTYSLSSRMSSNFVNNDTISAAQTGLQAASFAVNFVTCIASASATAAGIPLTAGLSSALTGSTALISCSAAIAGFVDFFESQNPQNQLIPNEIRVLSTTGDIIDGLSCLTLNPFACFNTALTLGSLGLEGLENALETINVIDISGIWNFTMNIGNGCLTWPAEVTFFSNGTWDYIEFASDCTNNMNVLYNGTWTVDNLDNISMIASGNQFTLDGSIVGNNNMNGTTNFGGGGSWTAFR